MSITYCVCGRAHVYCPILLTLIILEFIITLTEKISGVIMSKEKILTVQDISCVGQCSLTVALPIISACGIETCVLPTAVLSTHTAFKGNFTFRDLTCDIEPISKHWTAENITFRAIYTGYLGSRQQVDLILSVAERHLEKDGVLIVDPAMADGGILYKGFDDSFPKEMARLCSKTDVILPNITEACLMTDSEYKTNYDRDHISSLLRKLVIDKHTPRCQKVFFYIFCNFVLLML